MQSRHPGWTLFAEIVLVLLAVLAVPNVAAATEPCGGLGECRAIVEINATDGDIGFHWLADADDLLGTEIVDAQGERLFANAVYGGLRRQGLTESFGESSEPRCRPWLREEPDEPVVTVTQFVRRFPAGSYRFRGLLAEGGSVRGQTALTHWLPAAPRGLAFSGGIITWEAGTSLGVCASERELWSLVDTGVLPVHPINVPVVSWEVTLELEDDLHRSFTVRVPARGASAQTSITVPPEFLISVPADTPAKIEVGAIGGRLEIGDDDNATFSELGGLCLHRVHGCAEE
jgi:hypothetical protein